MKSIYNQFLYDLKNYYNDIKQNSTFSYDIKWYLELKNKRLQKNKITKKIIIDVNEDLIEKQFSEKNIPSTKNINETLSKINDVKKKGNLYLTNNLHEPKKLEKIYYLNNKKIYRLKKDVIFYVTTISLGENLNFDNETLYRCPNCGSISKVGNFINEGCSFCRTKYMIEDLFPKVTNYFYQDSFYINKNKSKKIKMNFKILAIISAIIGTLLGLVININNFVILSIIWCSFWLTLFSVFFVYILYSLYILIKIIFKSVSSIPIVTRILKSRNDMKHFFSKIDINYNVDKYTSNFISNFYIVMFSDDIMNLPMYESTKDISDYFKNIIDSKFEYIIFKTNNNEENLCNVTFDIYTTDLYFNHKKIRKRKNKWQVTFTKNIKDFNNEDFISPTAIKCPKCGGSYDLIKSKICPWCREETDYKKYDWVITKIEKY